MLSFRSSCFWRSVIASGRCMVSLSCAAAELGVPVCLLLKWTKELPRLQTHARSKKRAITPSGIDQLHPIEDELLMWIFS
jgi:hypothetical protein